MLLLGDQVYADEVSPERARVHPLAPRPRGAAGRDDRRLRGVHAALPRVVGRPADPLAALDRALGDDLRRPRRDRRLEHVAEWVDGDPRHGLVGRAHRRRLHVLLASTSTRATCRRRELDEDDIYQRVREADDGGELLRDYAFKADREVEGTRWSYCRDIGSARLVMIDSRAGRVLDPGERSMVDDDEWEWIEEHAHGRLRPPADRDVAAAVPGARAALPRGVERGGVRRRVGPGRRALRREAAPGRSTSSTGPAFASRSSA